jgi:hypothetical protein
LPLNIKAHILIDEKRLRSFLSSDFYFFFWLSNSSHLFDLETKYCERLTEIRRQVQNMISEKDTKEIEEKKESHKFILERIVNEKEQLSLSYEKYHYLDKKNFSAL